MEIHRSVGSGRELLRDGVVMEEGCGRCRVVWKGKQVGESDVWWNAMRI
jgi:hypothetical protein